MFSTYPLTVFVSGQAFHASYVHSLSKLKLWTNAAPPACGVSVSVASRTPASGSLAVNPKVWVPVSEHYKQRARREATSASAEPLVATDVMFPPRLSNAARREAERILNTAARRLLGEQFDGESFETTTRADRGALDCGTDQRTLLSTRQAIPVRRRVDCERLGRRTPA